MTFTNMTSRDIGNYIIQGEPDSQASREAILELIKRNKSLRHSVKQLGVVPKIEKLKQSNEALDNIEQVLAEVKGTEKNIKPFAWFFDSPIFNAFIEILNEIIPSLLWFSIDSSQSQGQEITLKEKEIRLAQLELEKKKLELEGFNLESERRLKESDLLLKMREYEAFIQKTNAEQLQLSITLASKIFDSYKPEDKIIPLEKRTEYVTRLSKSIYVLMQSPIKLRDISKNPSLLPEGLKSIVKEET